MQQSKRERKYPRKMTSFFGWSSNLKEVNCRARGQKKNKKLYRIQFKTTTRPKRQIDNRTPLNHQLKRQFYTRSIELEITEKKSLSAFNKIFIVFAWAEKNSISMSTKWCDLDFFCRQPKKKKKTHHSHFYEQVKLQMTHLECMMNGQRFF